MKEKSLYDKEELMQLSKEFLVATVLQLEKDKNYWINKAQEIHEEHRKGMREMWDLIDKKQIWNYI